MPDSGSTDPDPLCTIAAAELLNCVASREHDTTKCEAQLKALRACTRKQVSVLASQWQIRLLNVHAPCPSLMKLIGNMRGSSVCFLLRGGGVENSADDDQARIPIDVSTSGS